jgi:hypothetical protein
MYRSRRHAIVHLRPSSGVNRHLETSSSSPPIAASSVLLPSKRVSLSPGVTCCLNEGCRRSPKVGDPPIVTFHHLPRKLDFRFSCVPSCVRHFFRLDVSVGAGHREGFRRRKIRVTTQMALRQATETHVVSTNALCYTTLRRDRQA